MQNILLWHDGLYVCPSLEHLAEGAPVGRTPQELEARAIEARSAMARKLRAPGAVPGEVPVVVQTEREKHNDLRQALIDNFGYRASVLRDLPWVPPGYKGV